jgi:hypothetical protein
MKILIIAKNIDKSAAGIIYSKLIAGMLHCETHQIDILSNHEMFNFEKANRLYVVPDQKEFDERISKFLTIVLRCNTNGINWLSKARKFANLNLRNNYQWIISFVNGGTESFAHIGQHVAKLNKCKFYIHMVDPIPPVRGWETFDLYRRNLLYGIKKPLENCDIFSLSNPTMSRYQAKLLGLKNYFTICNPVYSGNLIQVDKVKDTGTFNYVYLGTLVTGPRNPYKLLKAFENLLMVHPNSQLLMYGNHNRFDRTQIPESIADKVIVEDFTTDTLKVIQKTDCFIDIDADLSYDVFISSKLTMYLSYDRPILSLTGSNSPARRLLNKLDKSCVVSSFDLKEIEDSLISVRKLEVDEEFMNQRNLFLKNHAVDKLCKIIFLKLNQ